MRAVIWLAVMLLALDVVILWLLSRNDKGPKSPRPLYAVA